MNSTDRQIASPVDSASARTAASMPVGPMRVLMYNLVEHVASNLALYVYYDQENRVMTYASWINPMTINTNPMAGAAGDNTWYLVSGNGVLNV